FITNRGTGKMGKCIAEQAYKRGAEVLLLRADNAVESDLNIKQEVFKTVEDLKKLLAKYCPKHDIIFHSASVSDFYPQETVKGKIDSNKSYSLTLIPTEKLINKIKKWNPHLILVGFKAVVNPNFEEIEDFGRQMNNDSQADYVVVNDVGRLDIGFGADYNEVYLLPKGGRLIKFAKQKKEIIAGLLLDTIINHD
ncbi:hypothetical protein A3I51_04350, partial [Candidatus Gottesmanbacteria bacterium RIFCSPLOWO2_02_FULL_38_8]